MAEHSLSCNLLVAVFERRRVAALLLSSNGITVSADEAAFVQAEAGRFSKVFGSENCRLALSGEKLLHGHKNKHTPNQVLHPDC